MIKKLDKLFNEKFEKRKSTLNQYLDNGAISTYEYLSLCDSAGVKIRMEIITGLMMAIAEDIQTIKEDMPYT